MFATLIANMAVIFMPIYFYFRSNYAISDKKNFTIKELFAFIIGEVVVGIALVHLSGFFLGIPIDARPLFFSISMIYFGWKITVPSMVIVEFIYLLLTDQTQLLPGLTLTLFIGFLMHVLKRLAANKFDDYGQLVTLVLFNVILEAMMAYILIRDLLTTLIFLFILSAVAYTIVSSLYLQMNDLRILRERSDYDYLTRLLNVRKFKERLEALEKSRHLDISIALMDLDLFKNFNDTYGHAAGDKILWGVAQVFAAYSGQNATVYRVGGEEFAVLMTGMGLKEAELFVADIMDNVVNRPIPLNREESVSVTMSVGLAMAAEDESLNKLWKRADRLMYKSKENGRNQLTVSEGID